MLFHAVRKFAVNADSASAFSAFYMEVRAVSAAVSVYRALACVPAETHYASIEAVKVKRAVYGCP